MIVTYEKLAKRERESRESRAATQWAEAEESQRRFCETSPPQPTNYCTLETCIPTGLEDLRPEDWYHTVYLTVSTTTRCVEARAKVGPFRSSPVIAPTRVPQGSRTCGKTVSASAAVEEARSTAVGEDAPISQETYKYPPNLDIQLLTTLILFPLPPPTSLPLSPSTLDHGVQGLGYSSYWGYVLRWGPPGSWSPKSGFNTRGRAVRREL
ncbi:hypothetical protein BC629DRAFT_1603707 [Irpex lacteus]|nr:hypothetical protein BC629DRAFT_1603707 [Irpex lacteus]